MRGFVVFSPTSHTTISRKATDWIGADLFAAPLESNIGTLLPCERGRRFYSRGNMALPGETVSPTETQNWLNCKNVYVVLRREANKLNNDAAINRRDALGFFQKCGAAMLALDTPIANAVTSGLQDAARAAEGNPTLDLAAEYAIFRGALVDMQTWMFNNFPKDGSGNAAVFGFTVDANGIRQFTNIALTAGQLSAFKSRLTTLISTISDIG